MINTWCLSECVSRILIGYSNKNPNKVVNPQAVSCFAYREYNGRKFYYPVVGIKAVKRNSNYDGHYEEYLEVVVSKHSYCQNPKGISTPITGADLISFEIKEGRIYDTHWLCPEFGSTLWRNLDMCEDCIMLFNIRD